MIGQLADYIRRHRADISADQRAVFHVIDGPDGGRQNLGLEMIVVIDLANLGDQVHAVEVDIVQTPDEGRDKGSAGLGGEKRLIG